MRTPAYAAAAAGPTNRILVRPAKRCGWMDVTCLLACAADDNHPGKGPPTSHCLQAVSREYFVVCGLAKSTRTHLQVLGLHGY